MSHTLCPTNLYARICGLKFHTMRQESIDPEAVGGKPNIAETRLPTW